ncbi:choice-of-anchor L domain-containing protein [Nannocystis bainbridge]|uniref:Choice-of-anchor L domain-containing protein n=1 Tax=Nannocystis bainbridge TaxID=2995303 RepID=A0ABT5E522_9BACT|nr:choice-of-anchor L domain-containing protein [Nannocystis bainbridge]MDC0720033.1 choice-of-anchor L domain-containing protein [Nannocystis bainbridge]
MRSPHSALIVAAACLLESGCLVTVFVKDAGSDDAGTSEATKSSDANDQMTQEPGPEEDSTSSGEALTTDPLAPPDFGFDVGEPEPWEFCSTALVACDADSEDIDRALGINCEGGLQTEGALTWTGPDGSRRVVSEQLGTTDVFAPTEGSRRVVLSTGDAEHLLLTLPQMPSLGNCPVTQTCPSTDWPGNDLPQLPPPIVTTPVECEANEKPPGPGDCSETVEAQWALGGDPRMAYDYTELRFSAVAPWFTTGLAFDFAFLTSEYPPRFPGGHNDMFIAWVASERYTGNIALDPDGNPIAAETLPYEIKLDPMPMACGDECPDIPLRGFAFEGHAGTAWYEGEVGLNPGESIEVVFALFDVGDPIVDSAVLLDGVRWLCAPPPASV